MKYQQSLQKTTLRLIEEEIVLNAEARNGVDATIYPDMRDTFYQ